ncbi:hypothetical protein BG842_05665 [Haladaptatus sp. W1]|uniref:DUF6276 family protein n=1 Tax=Haladaptatus sp. W1 TaxID=1897478 RepID=UPI000849B4A3|nr:DUF6276 family protein [Haladaptatus sp. W1]ODR79485.1 hypothetical protein BG842_05665 [Haladaptatus sp. W1]
MKCPECGGERRTFAVPSELRADVPDRPSSILLCTRCLAFEPVENPDVEPSNFAMISDDLPDEPAAAAGMVLATVLLSSLALYRQHVDALFDRVEAAGVDPLLVLDRLAADPNLDPNFDIESRRRQLLQLRD